MIMMKANFGISRGFPFFIFGRDRLPVFPLHCIKQKKRSIYISNKFNCR
jgi:hypothetical protein